MAAVRARDTKPELALRHRLHALGLRYRLNVRTLPGTPDLVFPRHKAVVFVHGCFWHGHDCPLFVIPRTRPEFWLAKIGANQCRDLRNHQLLLDSGWRIATVWECSMRGRGAPGAAQVASAVSGFVRQCSGREIHTKFDGCHPGSGFEDLRHLSPRATEAC